MSSKKWIFLRGLVRSSEHWGPFPEIFLKAFPEFEIERLDIRGNGSQHTSSSFLSMQDNVRDLRYRSKLLKNLATNEKINILSISMGGMIGAEWCRLFPNEIENFVAINTSDSGSSRFYQRLRPQSYLGILSAVLGGNNSPEVETKILDITTNLQSDAEKDKWASLFSKVPATSRANFVRQLLCASRYFFSKTPPSARTLLLCADKDRLVSSACSKNIAKLWGCELRLHAEAGHDLPLDDGAWICSQLKDFLSKY